MVDGDQYRAHELHSFQNYSYSTKTIIIYAVLSADHSSLRDCNATYSVGIKLMLSQTPPKPQPPTIA